MEYLLSRKQRKMLRHGTIIPQVIDEYGETNRKLIDQLAADGYVEIIRFAFVTTEKGKAVLQSNFSTLFWRFVPIVISIIAVIISIVK